MIEQPKSEKRNRESNTSVITHGTFASDAAWYRPGGDFYAALGANRPDLDVHDQSFTWTGAYSDAARRADALLLKQWIDDQGLASPDFFAHSHGGTVAHHATKKGVVFDRLVLMGWPVHQRWFPAFSNVQRIIDVRVNFDLVILLDRGGQRFRTNNFKPVVQLSSFYSPTENSDSTDLVGSAVHPTLHLKTLREKYGVAVGRGR